MNNIQLFDLILKSSFLTKTIILILAVYSVYSWAIIFDKIFKFRLIKMKMNKFDKLFWSGKALEDVYRSIKSNADHPQAAVFAAAMKEWELSSVVKVVQSEDKTKKAAVIERLENVMDSSISKSMIKIKSGMTSLLIIASTSTLFGLFGTVWGLMQSFQSISLLQDTSLVVIAPGITSALITTAEGLFVAAFATIFYMYYNAKISNLDDDLVNFSEDLAAILSRELNQ